MPDGGRLWQWDQWAHKWTCWGPYSFDAYQQVKAQYPRACFAFEKLRR